jgi:hypothetical protein
VTRGERTGLPRLEGKVSYAKRLRRALYLAGVARHPCTRPACMKMPKAGELCCPAGARDPLYAKTDTTLPVDFHSTRRAFCTALAKANVATSVAQVLAGHSDAKVHQHYVDAATIRALPAAAMLALPDLGPDRQRHCPSTEAKAAKYRAGHGTRTRDPELGKLMLYQLS